MRICLLSKEYPPDTGWGGIGVYTYQIAHGLKELGHEVEVVSLAGKVDANGSGQVASITNDEGVVIHRVPWTYLLRELGVVLVSTPFSHYVLKTTIALWTKFLELHSIKPFDVVEAPEHLAEGLFPAATKLAPLVVRLHTPHSKFIAEKFHNFYADFDNQFIGMLERMAIISADVITSPSEDLAGYVARDINYPRENIEIIRNPVNARQFCPEGEKAIAADGLLTVLFVGRLEERKGVQYLVQAIPKVVSKYKNVRFVLVGADTNTTANKTSVKAELEKSLKASGCLEFVNILPPVPFAKLPGYYRSADICVIPSLYDNAPNTCLEAMSSGKAIVGTNAGGMPEYMVHGESGLLVGAKDSDALSQAIVGLLENETERLRLAGNARKRVLQKFDRQVIASETIAAYKRAQDKHATSLGSAIYLKDQGQVLEDAKMMLYAYDKMFYDAIYNASLTFRIRHWARELKSRPKLFTAKVFVNTCNGLARLTGGKLPILPGLVTKLEAQIQAREEEGRKQLWQELANPSMMSNSWGVN